MVAIIIAVCLGVFLAGFVAGVTLEHALMIEEQTGVQSFPFLRDDDTPAANAIYDDPEHGA